LPKATTREGHGNGYPSHWERPWKGALPLQRMLLFNFIVRNVAPRGGNGKGKQVGSPFPTD